MKTSGTRCGSYRWGILASLSVCILMTPAWAADGLAPVVAASPPPVVAATAPTRRAVTVAAPRIAGRLSAAELGLIININDPYSVAVGEFYQTARQLNDVQVLRVDLPVRAELTPAEFAVLQARIVEAFGPDIQALALAWNEPYSVGCNSITGALALGYDAGLCQQSCAPSRASSYFNSASARPYADLRWRPSMLLAAKNVDMAQALIRRGVASDGTLGLRGAPPVHAHYLITSDKARSARAPLFPAAGRIKDVGVEIHVTLSNVLEGAERLLLYQTGLTHIDKLQTLHWMPGGLGDHLTSVGGRLDGRSGQMSALEWIASGATGSYGTVSEPCSHPQKFPHPQVVLLHYVQGATLIEAYWKSVAWPQQGLFIGEPLAAPFPLR